MAHHSSTKKAIRKTAKKTANNRSNKTKIKTYIKKVVAAASPADASQALVVAQSELMRGVSKGIIKKNTASRKISKLAKMLKKAALSK